MKSTLVMLMLLVSAASANTAAQAALTLTAYTGTYTGFASGWVFVHDQIWKIPGESIMDGVPVVLNESTAPSYGFDWNKLSTELLDRPSYQLGIALVGGEGGGGWYDSANYGFGPRDYPGLYVGSVVFTSKVDYTVFNQYIGSPLTRVWADMNLVPEPSAFILMGVLTCVMISYVRHRMRQTHRAAMYQREFDDDDE